jgi:PAS domain S-box-containing protein
MFIANSQFDHRLHSLSEAICLYTCDGNFCYINQAFTDLFGYRLNEIPHPAQWLEPCPANLRSSNNEAAGEPAVCRALCKNRDYIWVQWRSMEIGQGVLIARCSRTEKPQPGSGPSAGSARSFRTLAEMLPQVVYEMDTSGRITYSNQTGFETFGYEREDLARGLTVLDVIAPDDHQRAMSNMAALMSGKGKGLQEYTMVRKDGSTFPALTHAAPSEQVRGGAVGIIIDITQRKQMEEAIRASERRYRKNLEIAGRYQRFLLPQPKRINGLSLTYYFQPSTQVGGDMIDFFSIDEHSAGIMLVDVCGHDMAAAMTATALKVLVADHLKRTKSPAKTLELINAALYDLTPEDVFATCIIAVYHSDTYNLLWSSAGHLPPLHLPKNKPAQYLEHTSKVAGFFPKGDKKLVYKDHIQNMVPGDRMVFYSDGLSGARSIENQVLGLERLARELEMLAPTRVEKVPEEVARTIKRFTADQYTDDITMLIMEIS